MLRLTEPSMEAAHKLRMRKPGACLVPDGRQKR